MHAPKTIACLRNVLSIPGAVALILISIAACGCASNRMVRVEDGGFVLEGRRHFFVGVNFWQAVHMGMPSPPGDRGRLIAELDHLQRLGVSNIRILAAFEGPDSEPYRVTPAMMIEPGKYNADVLAGMDFLIAELDKRRMHAVVALTNFWEWSGGMAQYVSWCEGSEIPYPATNDWREFCDYAARFYGCDRCQHRFRCHIKTIIERFNPYTGRRYRDEPAIFAWELANEPRYYPSEWIDESARYIKSLDPNHMVTTGSEGDVGGEFEPTHDGKHIDYTTIHIWPQNWGWFDPEKPETYAAAERKARDYFWKHEKAARKLGKPMVLEEFGLARDWEPLHDCYDPKSPTTIRDRFFRAMYDCVYQSATSNGPATGSNIWVWSGASQPKSGSVGDPPHEKPGWYSVYDKDESTLRLIHRHASDLALQPPPLPKGD